MCAPTSMRIRSYQHPSEHNRSFLVHSHCTTTNTLRLAFDFGVVPSAVLSNLLACVVLLIGRLLQPRLGSPSQKRLVVCQAASWKTARRVCRACMTVISEGKARVSSVRLNG